jgi:ERF superfamily
MNEKLPATHAVAAALTYSPPELLNLAILKKADIAVIERLSTLAERWQESNDRRRALQAFNNAVADAKANIPTVKKTSRVKFESKKPGASDTDYMYEDFAAVAETVAPFLGAVGLSYRYRLAQPTVDSVTVTCVLSHRDGHMEETPLTCKVDPSGNKNHIQAISSAVTYLERITLKAALGLAAGKDDDGRDSSGPLNQEYAEMIRGEQIEELKAMCASVGCSEERFLSWAEAASFEKIPADYFQSCLDGLASFRKSA